jgi:hypothetical protein
MKGRGLQRADRYVRARQGGRHRPDRRGSAPDSSSIACLPHDRGADLRDSGREGRSVRQRRHGRMYCF